MQMQSRSAGAGWAWLKGGFEVFRNNRGALFGATVLLGLFMAIPTVVQLIAKPHGTGMLVWFGATTLLFGLLYPVLIGGFMRIVDGSRNGRPVSAWTVFEPFRARQGWPRLVVFGLCMSVMYLVFLAIVMMTVGRGVLHWYMQVLQAQADAGAIHALPTLPAGFGITFALLTVFFIFYSGAYAIGVCQAALRGAEPLAAFRDGISGAFKNVLPLVVLAVCGVLASIAFAIALVIVAVILVLLASLIGKAADIVPMVLAYVVMLLLVVPFMMGVNYAIWRDVAAGGEGAGAGLAVPGAEG